MRWPQDDWPMPGVVPPSSRRLGGVDIHVMVHYSDRSAPARRSATLDRNFVHAAEATKTLRMVLDRVDRLPRSSRLFSGLNGTTRMVPLSS